MDFLKKYAEVERAVMGLDEGFRRLGLPRAVEALRRDGRMPDGVADAFRRLQQARNHLVQAAPPAASIGDEDVRALAEVSAWLEA